MISRLKKECDNKPSTNKRIIRQMKRKRKLTPFFSARSICMKKLIPNRKAKILMNLPMMMLFPIHCTASSNIGKRRTSFSEGIPNIPKCWIICIRITPKRAKPLKASNMLIRLSGDDNDMLFVIIWILSLEIQPIGHF